MSELSPFERPAPPSRPNLESCPFKVGDRIHELRFDTIRRIWTKDEFKPDATVTAITAKGFDYRYDHIVPIGPARWGGWCEGGECYPEGFRFWERIYT